MAADVGFSPYLCNCLRRHLIPILLGVASVLKFFDAIEDIRYGIANGRAFLYHYGHQKNSYDRNKKCVFKFYDKTDVQMLQMDKN